MFHAIALILCTAFVLFLLRLEGRGARGVSPALWIPTVWMLATASKPLAIWFGVVGNNEGGSGLDQLLLTTLGIAGMVVLIRRRFNWQRALRRHGWLLALLCFMLISTIWSDITLIALRRWVRQVIVLIMALAIMSETNPYQALESVLRRFAYVYIPFSLVVIKYFPAYGVSYSWSGVQMWTGIALHKNGFGSMCTISALFFLWAYLQRRERAAAVRHQSWADISVLLIALFLLTGAQKNSATALTTLGVGIVTLLGLRLLRNVNFVVLKAVSLALVIFLIAFGVAAPFLGGSNVASFSSQLGRDDTLTGRTDVWAAVLPAMEQQPMLGYGFGSFWTDARRQFYEISDAHNGYLDILLELGAVGLTFYFGWLLSCARKFQDVLARNYNWASLAICYLVMALVFNVTESTLSGLVDQITVVVVLVSLVVPHVCSGQSDGVQGLTGTLMESNKECSSGASVYLLNPDEKSRVRSLLP
jgi:exopolysaccharide production protein ExoQ